jgi:hypothetical protein
MLAIVFEFSAARLKSLDARHGTAMIRRILLTPCLVTLDVPDADHRQTA